jgi:hypothetical protein
MLKSGTQTAPPRYIRLPFLFVQVEVYLCAVELTKEGAQRAKP